MKKRAITLLEIMIVIALIGIIVSVLGYNMRGTLSEGKAFKSEQAQRQIKEILLLELAKDDNLTAEQIAENPERYLSNSGLIKEPKKYMKDGWGKRFDVKVAKDGNDFIINSKSLTSYRNSKKKQLEQDEEEEL
jgi:general secretion pathway protein G